VAEIASLGRGVGAWVVHGDRDGLLPLDGPTGARALAAALGVTRLRATLGVDEEEDMARGGAPTTANDPEPEASTPSSSGAVAVSGARRPGGLVVVPGGSHSFLLERPREALAVVWRACHAATQAQKRL
jgi:hypothetical protein